MQKRLAIITAAALSLGMAGASALAAPPSAAQQQQKEQKDRANTVAPQLPPGTTRAEEQNSQPVGEAVAKILETATTPGQFNKLDDLLATQDRQRVEQDEKKLNTGDLDQKLQQLHQAFQNKYQRKLNYAQGDTLADTRMVQGQITDPQAFSPAWPVDPTPSASAVAQDRREAQQASARQDSDEQPKYQGRMIAVVRLGPVHNLGPVDLSMLHEGEAGWLLDIPNLSAQQLHDNLISHLDQVIADKSNWPKDATQAQRYIAHQVATALYGVDATSGANDQGGMNGQSGKQ